MPARPVDLRGAFVVDLPRGRLEARENQRVVALPADAFATLIESLPSDRLEAFAASLAQAVTHEARAMLDGSADASPEDVAYVLSAAVGLRGLGTIRFEQWGHALVLVWGDPPARNESLRRVARAVVTKAVSTFGGSSVDAVLVGGRDDALRFLVATRAVCDYVQARVHAGASWGEIVTSLVLEGT